MPAPADAALPALELYPLGEAAVVLSFGGGISAATHRAIAAVSAWLGQHPFAGLREWVPAFTTLTVYYDPWLLRGHGSPYEAVCAALRQLLPAALAAGYAMAAGEVIEIPVCYGGAFGPDLALVARHTGLPPAEVIARHAAPDYLVHLLGFAPGFPYLGGLDARLAAPRRAAPRPLVPAGAVGIAGTQTGIYSLPTPGGWQLIGRTPLRLFDPGWEHPSRLRAGQHLRFVPIDETDFQRFQHEP